MLLKVFLLILMTMVSAIGGYNFKMITIKESNKNALKSIYFYYGLGFYFMSAVINIYLLKLLPLTFVLPATSLSFIWIQLISRIKLKETITFKKVIAMTFICLGVIFIGMG